MGPYVHPGDTAIDLGCGGGFFTISLAEMVGENGRVIAVDLQEEMLQATREFAARKGVLNRISLHQCRADDISLTDLKADFALAFYVVHEVPDRQRFLKQVVDLLKPGAHLMLIEPRHHVKDLEIEQTLASVIGLTPVKQIKSFMSRGMVFAF